MIKRSKAKKPLKQPKNGWKALWNKGLMEENDQFNVSFYRVIEIELLQFGYRLSESQKKQIYVLT